MIADVMAYCHNYFDAEPDSGTFSIDGGVIDYAGVCSYIRISGSTYNDGVWHYADGVLTDDNGNAPTDEVFDGEIAQLAPPPQFIRLCDKIAKYEEKTPVSAVASESFGGYSRTMLNGAAASWQKQFEAELQRYWRPFSEVLC